MKGLFIYCVTLLLILYSCASKDIDENREIKTIIAKYNNALIEAYKNQFFEPLKDVAAEDEVRKIEVIINSYLHGKQIMESEIHKIDFRDIKAEGDKAIVKTAEDWSFRWLDYKTRQEVEPLKDEHCEMIYHLSKKDGKWLEEKMEIAKGVASQQ